MGKGLAYPVNGSVYFRVSKHGKYGSLAGLDRSGMQVRARWGGRKRTKRKETFHVLAFSGREACVEHRRPDDGYTVQYVRYIALAEDFARF